jgi:hypothetical protein
MPTDGESMTDEEQAVIAVITDAIRDKFGARALDIARGQFDTATGDARKTWAAIVARLEAPPPGS